MARSVIFVLCMIVASSLAENQNTNVNVAVVENLDEYLSQHPEVKLLQKLEKVIAPKSESPLLLITYRLGNRIAGDRVVGTGSGNQSWGSAQDVKLTLQYPKSGIGSVITFVQIPVEQSTNLGQGYVTSGGIGQRQITIVIEAKATLYFRYNAQIFGY